MGTICKCNIIYNKHRYSMGADLTTLWYDSYILYEFLVYMASGLYYNHIIPGIPFYNSMVTVYI